MLPDDLRAGEQEGRSLAWWERVVIALLLLTLAVGLSLMLLVGGGVLVQLAILTLIVLGLLGGVAYLARRAR